MVRTGAESKPTGTSTFQFTPTKWRKHDEVSDYPEACANIHEWIGNDNNTHTTIIGIDANTTLPRNIPNITGNFILEPLSLHNPLSQSRILNLIEPLGLKAPQTYAQKGHNNLVTRSENGSQSQIDYILCPQHKKGKAYVMKFTGENLKSDHHPVILYMDDEEDTTSTTKQHSTTPSTKGWIPKTIA